jgi:hypothetical protein
VLGVALKGVFASERLRCRVCVCSPMLTGEDEPMKSNHKLEVAVLAGISMSALRPECTDEINIKFFRLAGLRSR